jgi:hypothetical protein
MALLGKAALAMWWDVSPEVQAEWEHWHAHEHFPERLAIPGFLRGSRWTDVAGGEGFFVMYELQDHSVLASAPYVARLNAPSPWSTRMMPLHRNMVRSQCKVVQSHGAVTARHALTIRCSPADGRAQALERELGELAASVSQQPGTVGMHVLRHEAPPLAATTEQKIRGNSDRTADWVVVACGYDLDALRALAEEPLGDAALRASGAAPGIERQLYGLAYSATPADVR